VPNDGSREKRKQLNIKVENVKNVAIINVMMLLNFTI